MFECPALEEVRDRYTGLLNRAYSNIAKFGDHAATMLHIMWQHDTCAVALYIKNVQTLTMVLALKAGHHISPRWLELMQSFSLYIPLPSHR